MSFKTIVINVDSILHSRADEMQNKKIFIWKCIFLSFVYGQWTDWTMNIEHLLVDNFSSVFCYIKSRCLVAATNNRSEQFFFFFILHSFIYWKLSTWLLHFESHITFAWHLILYISIYHYMSSVVVIVVVVIVIFSYEPRTTFCRPTIFIPKSQ